MSSSFRSYRTSRLVLPTGVCAAVCAAISAPSWAVAPPSNATPLQQNIFAAVVNMCVGNLDGPANIARNNALPTAAQTTDLHDQCHAIAGAATNSGVFGSAATPQALAALQQVSGNQTTAQGSLASRVSAGQFANISGRLNALRFGSHAAISGGTLASNDDSPASAGPRSFYFDNAMFASKAPDLTLLPSAGSYLNASFAEDGSIHLISDGTGGGSGSSGGPTVSNPFGVFVQGSYNSGHHDATAAEDPFNFHATSITAGVDYNFGPGIVGVSLGYDDYDAGFRPNGTTVTNGSARVEGTSASLYGAWFSDHWSFNGIASYGRLHTNLTRAISYTASFAQAFDQQNDLTPIDLASCVNGTCSVTNNRTLQGNPSGGSYAIGATAGYAYSVAAFDLQPSLSLNYRRSTIDAFNERDTTDPTDGLPLAFNDQTIESLRTVLGLDVSRAFSAPFGVITPLAHVEWDHEFHTSGPNIQAHYVFDPSLQQGQCSSCFTLPTDDAPSNYGVAGLGASVTLAHRLQAFVYDEVLVGYRDYHSNTVTFGLRGQL